ncbi:N-acetylneuraminate synthase [Marinitoga hydrogenitolerans DSM 16785]|uniref:N-acetylneuraminate synthase n=1 Tax=Marinitoga hydrogenitolerans (strain DSM 16785 / JCM 12826 / AT1271) TaxID=1122195 RepID=A0A1M4Y3W7_MARH1|nr:N-acetylneuraminate synthase family protein [Marinitoga hydrogenitolerans]SHF00273.1 N-acetylneuraminate synthase [Marinitoga hydrogenitolerans DSM 16785]
MVKIGKKILDKKRPFDKPYIIAEAGVNHEGDFEKAKIMIEEAAEAGADAIKFQTYKAEKLASKFSPSYWDTTKESTKSQYELFKKYDKFWKKEYEELAKYAEKCGIDFMSTPFDFESADFLEPLIPAYKIASADITNIPFLKHIARKGKTILLSTGASSISEIWKAVEAIKSEGNNDIVLLHCVLNYPTDEKNANLGMIKDMKEKFSDYIIGYSDHTLPTVMKDVLSTAWLLGAQVIEKHFTFDKTLPGNDHYHAMDKNDLRTFNEYITKLQKIIGRTEKGYLESEIPARNNARRSLVAARFIPKGKIIEKGDIAIKRPGIGVSPELYEKIIGSIATRDINDDEILHFGDFKEVSF